MKTQIAFKSAVVSAMALTFTAAAQTFSGTNAKLNAQNQFYFTINGPAGVACSIQSSTNLLNWTTLSNIGTFPGSMNYTSPATGRAQFFRVKQ